MEHWSITCHHIEKARIDISFKQAHVTVFPGFFYMISMLHHILNQNSIPSAGILYKHMCHRPGQLPILYDRRTAHE